MRGFQLWINLPAAEKMKPAAYRDIRPEEIPTAALPGGGEVRVIAGSIVVDGRKVAAGAGSIDRTALHRRSAACGRTLLSGGSCGPQRFHLCLRGQCGHRPHGRPSHAGGTRCRRAWRGQRGGNQRGKRCRSLPVAGRPASGEPVVQHGPFVMNTARKSNSHNRFPQQPAGLMKVRAGVSGTPLRGSASRGCRSPATKRNPGCVEIAGRQAPTLRKRQMPRKLRRTHPYRGASAKEEPIMPLISCFTAS